MIPGVFTYEGWKGPFQVAMGRVLEGLGSEARVVGEPDTKQIDLERGIKTLYFQDYRLHWRAFLKSLSLGPAVTPTDMEKLLSILSLPDCPSCEYWLGPQTSYLRAPKAVLPRRTITSGGVPRLPPDPNMGPVPVETQL